MLAGSACATAGGGARFALFAFAAVKLVGYTLWLQANRGYVVVQVDGAITLSLLALLHALDARRGASRWMLAGVAATAAGELFNPMLHFAALACYWRGAATMNDRRIEK